MTRQRQPSLTAALDGTLTEHESHALYLQFDVFKTGEYGKPMIRYRQQASVPVYPASVVKLFYMVALFRLEQSGDVHLTPEDHRALSDMIQLSGNEATQFLLSRMTGAWNGPMQNDADLDVWWTKRRKVQRLFDDLHESDFEHISLGHSTYEVSPYGCEQAARRFGRNALTAQACNRLLLLLLQNQWLTEDRSRACWALLDRSRERFDSLPADRLQTDGFLGQNLKNTTQLWSKAGWTSQTRHDVARIEANGKTGLLSVFCESPSMAQRTDWLPIIGCWAEQILELN